MLKPEQLNTPIGLIFFIVIALPLWQMNGKTSGRRKRGGKKGERMAPFYVCLFLQLEPTDEKTEKGQDHATE